MIGHEDKTIIAQSTAKGAGAIAMIRLSGSMAINIASSISNKNLSVVASHTVHYSTITDEHDKNLDQVMLIVMKAPKTFTGQDVVEITCHNNPFIIDKIINRCIEFGARLAQPGEFAQRAFLNGKIDLLQAEAINELIGAHTQEALKKSLSQLEGSFSHWISQIEQQLIKCLVLNEASFEFIDDEIEFGPQILEQIQEIKSQVSDVKKTFNNQQQIKEGIKIAIIGSVNAGKSSLFNALLKKNRAIVSDIAGTTRDSIEASIYNNEHYMSIVDTAGLRQTNDIIEQEGIKRSMQEAQKADIILLVFDASRKLSQQEQEIYKNIINSFESKIILVINKIDISNKLKTDIDLKNAIKISSKTNENIDLLQQEIQNKIKTLFELNNSPFLLNKRQFNLLNDLENKLIEIEQMLNKKVEYELLSIHINESLQAISQLTGKNIAENAMDAIFKEFCVGK